MGDRRTAEALIAGESFRLSVNDYDWLGDGAYFWEANPLRGLDYARRAARRMGSGITDPAVVGAVIDLGACLDLTTAFGIETLRGAHDRLKDEVALIGYEMPENQDRLRRQLDRAVIEMAHQIEASVGTPFDTVRGVFTEGKPVYPGSGFDAETHVQIAVRNLDCIKGVFRVPDAHLET